MGLFVHLFFLPQQMFIEIVLWAKAGIDIRNLEMKGRDLHKKHLQASGLAFSNWGMVASREVMEIRCEAELLGYREQGAPV